MKTNLQTNPKEFRQTSCVNTVYSSVELQAESEAVHKQIKLTMAMSLLTEYNEWTVCEKWEKISSAQSLNATNILLLISPSASCSHVSFSILLPSLHQHSAPISLQQTARYWHFTQHPFSAERLTHHFEISVHQATYQKCNQQSKQQSAFQQPSLSFDSWTFHSVFFLMKTSYSFLGRWSLPTVTRRNNQRSMRAKWDGHRDHSCCAAASWTWFISLRSLLSHKMHQFSSLRACQCQ